MNVKTTKEILVECGVALLHPLNADEMIKVNQKWIPLKEHEAFVEKIIAKLEDMHDYFTSNTYHEIWDLIEELKERGAE